MNDKKQKQAQPSLTLMTDKKLDSLVNVMLSSPEVMTTMSTVIKPEYFSDHKRKVVKFALDYYNKYKAMPNAFCLDEEVGYVVRKIEQITPDLVARTCDELEQYCKDSALNNALEEMATRRAMGEGTIDEFRELINVASTVGRPMDIGMRVFHNIQHNMDMTAQNSIRYSTGISILDKFLDEAGLARKEVLMLTANSGGKKSMAMANLGVNMAKLHGMKIVYYSLELPEHLVFRRMVSMLTGVPQHQLKGLEGRAKGVALLEALGLNEDQIVIKRFVANVNSCRDIENHLSQLKVQLNFKPDIIILDYLDIVNTSSPLPKGEGVFKKDQIVAEEFRNLIFEQDAIGITASQQGRSAFEAETLGQQHIQGGISKINTFDWVVGIKNSPVLEAANEIELHGLKARSSAMTGETMKVGWDRTWLKFTNIANNSSAFKSPTQKRLESYPSLPSTPSITRPSFVGKPATDLQSLLDD